MQPVVTCRTRGFFPALMLGLFAVFTVVTIAVVVVPLTRGTMDLAEAVPFFFILPFVWYVAIFRFSYEVRLYPDGTLTAKSLGRTTTFSADEVVEVGTRQLEPNVVSIRTTSRRITLPRPVNNLFELATRLRELNPAVELRRL